MHLDEKTNDLLAFLALFFALGSPQNVVGLRIPKIFFRALMRSNYFLYHTKTCLSFSFSKGGLTRGDVIDRLANGMYACRFVCFKNFSL